MMSHMTLAPICTAEGCDQPRSSRWRCREHYARARGCSVDGCVRKHYGNDLCHMHWARVHRGGDVGGLEAQRGPDRVCSIEGCGRPHLSRSWCRLHYSRWESNGNPLIARKRPVPPARHGSDNASWKGDAVSYSGVHYRLKQARGEARNQACACGARGDQWAYDHSDPRGLVSDRGHSFSPDLWRYEAMCYSCHTRADHARKVVIA
jgi:hypothetical protein